MPSDDTGGNIERREMDFTVVSDENFRPSLGALSRLIRAAPRVEHPRCAPLRVD